MAQRVLPEIDFDFQTVDEEVFKVDKNILPFFGLEWNPNKDGFVKLPFKAEIFENILALCEMMKVMDAGANIHENGNIRRFLIRMNAQDLFLLVRAAYELKMEDLKYTICWVLSSKIDNRQLDELLRSFRREQQVSQQSRVIRAVAFR